MPVSLPKLESAAPALEAFLLGQVDFDRVLALQRRLVEHARDRDDGQVTLLLCEHRPIITLGRGGSPGDVAMHSGLVRSGQVEVRWVNRGGGCLVHCPGQLAVYPIVPLRWHGLTVGGFLDRLRRAIVETLEDVRVPVTTEPQPTAETGASSGRGFSGIWGRTGQLAALGVAVRHWVTYYGAYLNVCPPTGLLRLVQAETGTVAICAKQTGRTGRWRPSLFPLSMSSLVAERCGPVRMTAIRAALVRRLANSFGCDRYHLYTGHPLLRDTPGRRAGDR
ncbi:MAG: hypothetical protein LLG00_04790 [Planctomycetaceae bacterium]|nr:hypothetical protein [Planctomycetaceae bacterium]